MCPILLLLKIVDFCVYDIAYLKTTTIVFYIYTRYYRYRDDVQMRINVPESNVSRMLSADTDTDTNNPMKQLRAAVSATFKVTENIATEKLNWLIED